MLSFDRRPGGKNCLNYQLIFFLLTKVGAEIDKCDINWSALRCSARR